MRVWTGGEEITCPLKIVCRHDDLLGAAGHPVERACSHIRLAVGAIDALAAKESADDLGLGFVRSDGHDDEIVHSAESTQESAILGSLSGA
jgi:hypothetical protein